MLWIAQVVLALLAASVYADEIKKSASSYKAIPPGNWVPQDSKPVKTQEPAGLNLAAGTRKGVQAMPPGKWITQDLKDEKTQKPTSSDVKARRGVHAHMHVRSSKFNHVPQVSSQKVGPDGKPLRGRKFINRGSKHNKRLYINSYSSQRNAQKQKKSENLFPPNVHKSELFNFRLPNKDFCNQANLEPHQQYMLLPWWYYYCMNYLEKKNKRFNNQYYIPYYKYVLDKVKVYKKLQQARNKHFGEIEQNSMQKLFNT